MGKNYVERSKEELDALLIGKYKFRIVRLDGTAEYVYQRDGVQIPYSIRVYSSVDVRTGVTRDCGDDAIRVVMVEQATGKARKIMGEKANASTGTRINRTKNAMVNLEKRVRQYMLMGTFYRCPKCEGLMAVRENKGNGEKFLGCLEYPECKGTRPMPDFD